MNQPVIDILDEPFLIPFLLSEPLADEVSGALLLPMFRKPRETPAPVASENPIRHSTGRPPTPPLSTKVQSSPRTNASTTYDMASATPLVGKTKPFQKGTPTTANGSAAKANGKAKSNGNIMSFFKKAESTRAIGTLRKEDEDTLFLDEIPMNLDRQAPFQTPTPPRDEGFPGDVEMTRAGSPISRYNEATVPVKRRRIEEAADQPPMLEAGQAPEAPRKGPFADDSESDDEGPVTLDMIKPVLKTPVGYSGAKTSKPSSTSVNCLHGVEQEYSPPQLEQEATSMSRDNDFEGMGDFIDEEFPEDGEEFMERRWMEEQEMGLEDEDEDVGAITTPKEEPRESPIIMPQNSGSACCPICSGSTAGMAEQVSQEYQQMNYGLTAHSKYRCTSMTA